MSNETEFKQDHLFAFLACLCWFVLVPTMLFAGVWQDARWFGSAVLTIAVGFGLAWISLHIDKSFKRRGILK